jgi:hypothetical protein
MPPILKALATIAVWILFIVGCLAILFGVLAAITRVGLGGAHAWGGGVVSIMLSVVAAWLRKKLD